MSWRDQLLPASLDGVSFFVDSHEHGFGRRRALHEYPDRDRPYPEDLGRRTREYTIEAYVLASAIVGGARGDDYFSARDALLRTCENPGSKSLVHPYLGALDVAITDCRLRESSAEGGLARFTITCVESGDNLFPSATSDTTGAVGSACDVATALVKDDFAKSFDVDDTFAYLADSATSTLNGLSESLRKESARIAKIGSKLTAISASIDRFGDAIGSLIRAPVNLANDAVGVIVAVAGVTSDVRAGLGVYERLFDFGSDEAAIPLTTTTRQQQVNNQAALHALVQRTAAIEAARAAAAIEYDSNDDALSVRDSIADQLDALMEGAPDDVFAALSDVRAAMVRDITTRGADLARIVSFTPTTTLPALVVAHALYGDAARDGEVITRNRLRHPGFVRGGQPLEVLADA